jgi:hypothetical protein
MAIAQMMLTARRYCLSAEAEVACPEDFRQISIPDFANPRKVCNALDQACHRQATHLLTKRGKPVAKQNLKTIAAQGIL